MMLVRPRSAIIFLLIFLTISGCFGSTTKNDANKGDPKALTIYTIENFDLMDRKNETFVDPLIIQLGHKKSDQTRWNGLWLQKAQGYLTRDLLLEYPKYNGSGVDFTEDLYVTVPSALPFLIQRGVALDLTDLIRAENLDLLHLDPYLMDSIKLFSGGKGIYALPFQRIVPMLFYKKEVFEMCKIPYPTNGMTWDEVLLLSEQLVSCNPNIIGLKLWMEEYISIASQLGLTFLNPSSDEALVDTETWRRMFEFYRRIQRSSGSTISNDQDTKIVAMFASGNKMGTGKVNTSLSKWGAVSFPTFVENPGVDPQASGLVIVLNATKVQNREAAFDVAKHMISYEYQRALNVSSGQNVYGTARTESELRDRDGSFFTFESEKKAMHFNKPIRLPSISMYEPYILRPLERVVNHPYFINVITSDEPLDQMLKNFKGIIDNGINLLKEEWREASE